MRSQHARIQLIAMIFGLVGGLSASVWAQNPAQVGTWKLNLAKSKLPSGQAPRSVVLKIEATGMMATTTVDAVGPDGASSHWAFTGAYVGKDVPLSGNNPFGYETASRKRISATTTETTYKKGGMVLGVTTSVLSSDGKTLTITAKSTDEQGRPVSNVQVYDKQ